MTISQKKEKKNLSYSKYGYGKKGFIAECKNEIHFHWKTFQSLLFTMHPSIWTTGACKREMLPNSSKRNKKVVERNRLADRILRGVGDHT